MTATSAFRLLWTIGFSGKRHLTREQEGRVAKAVDQAVQFLCESADEQQADLTAVSSIARTCDVLFARVCLTPRQIGQRSRVRVPWKCVLPFEQERFLDVDLFDAPAGGRSRPLDPKERAARRDAAMDCLRQKSGLEVLPFDPGSDEAAARVAAWLEGGYRVVDESDVMVFVLRDEEFAELLGPTDQHGIGRATALSLKAGTRAVALYAAAAKRPCILLNADAQDPWAQRRCLNEPTTAAPWFFDAHVTKVVHLAFEHALPRPTSPAPWPGIPRTAHWAAVSDLMHRLDAWAGACQRSTLRGLKSILTLHIVATAIAAAGATVLDVHPAGVAALGLVLLALTKPLLAALALWIERRQHERHERESWLYARILAELCRGALAMWPLPLQPLDAIDEEDFPKIKRMQRTLRLLRELDGGAGVVGTTRRGSPDQPAHEHETQVEADMRAACDHYVTQRLEDQSAYYRRELAKSSLQLMRWSRAFHSALYGTIAAGVLLALHKLPMWLGPPPSAAPEPVLALLDVWSWIELIVIVGPFLASYALGMTTVLDCRRRARRYEEMRNALERLTKTLRQCAANSSRLRLIEHAERMLIEEQHEWFSTTRNFSV